MRKTPFVVISTSLILWLIGIVAGEITDVVTRAASVCLECMGIG